MPAAAVTLWMLRGIGMLPTPVRAALDRWSYRRAQQRKARRLELIRSKQMAR